MNVLKDFTARFQELPTAHRAPVLAQEIFHTTVCTEWKPTLPQTLVTLSNISIDTTEDT